MISEQRKKELRNILFVHRDKSVVRTKLELPGSMVKPPLVLVFRNKIYRNAGCGIQSISYHEIPDDYMIIEEDSKDT